MKQESKITVYEEVGNSYQDVKLIGVFPESQVTMPKINPTQKYPNQLTNGHTHLFMLAGKTGQWGSEAQVKYLLAKTIARGDRETMRIQKGTGMPKHFNTDPSCKVVYILMGDSPASEWLADIQIVKFLYQAVENNLPIILVKGSQMCNGLIDHLSGKSKIHNERSSFLLRIRKTVRAGSLLCS